MVEMPSTRAQCCSQVQYWITFEYCVIVSHQDIVHIFNWHRRAYDRLDSIQSYPHSSSQAKEIFNTRAASTQPHRGTPHTHTHKYTRIRCSCTGTKMKRKYDYNSAPRLKANSDIAYFSGISMYSTVAAWTESLPMRLIALCMQMDVLFVPCSSISGCSQHKTYALDLCFCIRQGPGDRWSVPSRCRTLTLTAHKLCAVP